MTAVEIAGKYVSTFLEVWHFRPKVLLLERDRDQSYLSPSVFLAATLGIVFGSILTAAMLSQLLIWGSPAEPSLTADKAVGVATALLVFLILLVNSLFYRIISPLWPVRGTATFTSMFSVQCYTLAIGVASSAMLSVLYVPLLEVLVAAGHLERTASFWIPGAIGGLFGTISAFWSVSGLAVVNGVSTARMWAGLLLWSGLVGFGLGAAASAIFLVGA